jgi:hypothetical protein
MRTARRATGRLDPPVMAVNAGCFGQARRGHVRPPEVRGHETSQLSVTPYQQTRFRRGQGRGQVPSEAVTVAAPT